MIRIKPTTVSGLSATDYSVDIPGELNLVRPRSKKVTTNLSGGASVTVWAKNNEGAEQTIQVIIPEETYKKLITIIEHPTVYEWLVSCNDKRYVCAIDYENPVSLGLKEKQVSLVFTVVTQM